jgi:aminopeptidase-like protein
MGRKWGDFIGQRMKTMDDIDLSVRERLEEIGRELYGFMAELYPIPRSITGNGLRETLHRIKERIPLNIHEVPSGTKVFDWVVPKEWNIKDAYVKDSKGQRVIDFKKSNLHVVNSSIPVNTRMSLEKLKEHLHTLPDKPDWIPYRYSHYNEEWGFCLSHRKFSELKNDEYEVCIDSSLKNGSLTYGECYLRGQSSDEVLMSTHVCHPSLANDNLSGIAIATFLAQYLGRFKLRYSYRFIFIPSTIGAITWLSLNDANVARIKHGLVLACLGDSGCSTYKKSRRGNEEIDRAITHVLKHSVEPFEIKDFSPYGYDERQFNSPGFNLPVGLLTRTPHDCFSEYHTSADNLDFVLPSSLGNSFYKCLSSVYILEHNKVYINLSPKGEPRLGKRGLYRQLSGQADGRFDELPLLWVLNLSDGDHSLLDIAERSDIEFSRIKKAADALLGVGLLREMATVHKVKL